MWHVQLWWELSEDDQDKCSQVQMAAQPQRNKLFSLCGNIFFSGKDFWCRVKIIGEDYSGEYEKLRKFWITMEWLHRVCPTAHQRGNNLKLRRSPELRYRTECDTYKPSFLMLIAIKQNRKITRWLEYIGILVYLLAKVYNYIRSLSILAASSQEPANIATFFRLTNFCRASPN